MKRAWPFLIAAIVFAYLGVAPATESVYAGPAPSLLEDGWHVASLICAALFFGVGIWSYRR